MAPPKLLRTYSRGNNSSINCIEAMNILFAKNLTERKLHRKICKGKNKVQIKELPKKIKTVLSDESSLHVNINDTFDKLFKSTRNNVKSTNDMSVKIIAKKKSTSVIKHFNKFNISPGFSPQITKLRSFKSSSQNFEETSSCSWFKQPTPPGVNVTNDLEIEVIGMSKRKVNNSQKKSKQNSSRDSPIMLRSHKKIPDIIVTENSRHKNAAGESLITKERNKSNKIDEKKNNESSIIAPNNLSYNPIFTNSVREKIVMHSSTPLISKSKTMRFVKHPISPIKTSDETDDINKEINNSILKSLEEIKSWDQKFPNIDPENNKLDSLSRIEDFKGFEKQEKGGNSQLDIKKDNFVTVRGRKMNKMTMDFEKNKNLSNKTTSCNLEEFELFYNKSRTRSFKLEDFERFHNNFTEQLSSRLTQSQVNKLNSISLKDFESFYTAYQNKMSMKRDSFLFKSNRTINYVTNRKHRLSRNPVNLSKKYLKLSKEFDLKNLVVVLDNVLVKNKTEKIKRNGSLCKTALMNSISRKQRVINLSRLSIKQPSFKAKDRVSLNNYKACRKFSLNSTAINKSNTLPCSDIFDLGQLFINLTRMPLSISTSPKISDLKDDFVVKRKERTLEKSTRTSRGPEKYKENAVKSGSTSEKEKESVNRKSKKIYGRSKSTDPTLEKTCSFSSPDHKTFKSADYLLQESLSNSRQVRASKYTQSTNRKSKLVAFEETDSEDEPTDIQLSLFSKSFKNPINNNANGEKKYVAKIFVGSASDTEVELRNTDSSVIREIGKNLRSWSQENVFSHSTKATDASELGNSFKKRMPSRVFRSHNNFSLNNSGTCKKTEIRLHQPSSTDLTREVNSRLYDKYQPDSGITYRAEDMSDSILFDTLYNTDEDSSASPQLKDIVVNLTIHKSWDKFNDSSNNVTSRKSTKLTKRWNEENNLSSNKTDKSKSQSKHKNSSSNHNVSNTDASTNDTPNNTNRTTRLSAKKSVALDHEKSLSFIQSNVTDSDIIESSVTSANVDCFKAPMNVVNNWKQKITNLKGGKSWRRSLLVHKRGSVIDLTDDLDDASLLSTVSSYSTSSARQNSLLPQKLPIKRQSIKIVPLCDPRLSRRRTVLQTYAQSNLNTILDDSIPDVTILPPRKCKLSLEKLLPLITAKDIVLKRCGQTEPQPFEKLYPKSLLNDCKKIGEGVYGEVFLYTNPSGDTTVMKVIPIEGSKIVNQERQKKFDEILSEIIIASELSKLRKDTTNQTSAFSEVQRICCVKGKYPRNLLDLWDAYDSSKGSENDHPKVFEDDQLYIVLDLANGGRDLEAFVFNNALQAVSMLKQVACALAVAEQQMQFEHRDLHWGNVLLKSVDKNKKVICKHKGETIESHSQGVEATIIDFTLSRIVHDGVVIFNDLGQDPDLFAAEGDYQFEIYRLMREKNSNNWQTFEPHTNVLWLHYIIDKSITALRYKNINSKVHKKNIACLKKYEKAILNFNSVSEFVSEYY